jgi:hypothetical protein
MKTNSIILSLALVVGVTLFFSFKQGTNDAKQYLTIHLEGNGLRPETIDVCDENGVHTKQDITKVKDMAISINTYLNEYSKKGYKLVNVVTNGIANKETKKEAVYLIFEKQ